MLPVFLRASSAPSSPSASPGVPSGWNDSPPAGTDLLFAVNGTKGEGATNFTWGTVFQVEGTAVAETTIYRLNSNTGNSGGSYNFTNSTLAPPSNWSATSPALANNNDVVYAANGLFSGAPTATAATTTWSTPVVYARRTDGTNGNNGATGAAGPTGSAGAGVVHRGEWEASETYTSNATRKDVVKYHIKNEKPTYFAGEFVEVMDNTREKIIKPAYRAMPVAVKIFYDKVRYKV